MFIVFCLIITFTRLPWLSSIDQKYLFLNLLHVSSRTKSLLTFNLEINKYKCNCNTGLQIKRLRYTHLKNFYKLENPIIPFSFSVLQFMLYLLVRFTFCFGNTEVNKHRPCCTSCWKEKKHCPFPQRVDAPHEKEEDKENSDVTVNGCKRVGPPLRVLGDQLWYHKPGNTAETEAVGKQVCGQCNDR